MTDEKRTQSSDTVPIPQDVLRQRLRGGFGPAVDEPYEPVPDEEPTAPDLLAERACVRCKGSGKAVEERPDGSYRGPIECPRCKGGRIDPDATPSSSPSQEPTR